MADLASLLNNPQLLTLGIGLIYSLAGWFEGVRTGQEKFDVVRFGKTILTFGLAAGFVTPATAGQYSALLDAAAPTGLAFVIDQATSKLLTAHRAGGSAPPPAPAPAPAPQPSS